jgi:hypothetical protein
MGPGLGLPDQARVGAASRVYALNPSPLPSLIALPIAGPAAQTPTKLHPCSPLPPDT